MVDLEQYRLTEREQLRTKDLLNLLPKGRSSVLDVGARDGHFSRLLTGYFETVTALDLRKPSFEYPRVRTVAGDITRLDFPGNTFDCVFCAEVLEHIPDVQKACRELIRVARHEIVIGVPFRQDLRCSRTTCRSCGKTNPPWGHVNSFDEQRLLQLFPGVRLVAKSFVWTSKDATNALSAALMDLAGNPWGTYSQDEPCIHCGAAITPHPVRGARRIFSALAIRIDRAQSLFVRPHANWIHVVFSK